jgi:hypothetical protein
MPQVPLLRPNGTPLTGSIGQYGSRRNKYLWRGLKVVVPVSARKVYLPRKKHYAPTVLTEEDGHEDKADLYLESLHETLEPCVELRGMDGWNRWHECNYHRVYIEHNNNGPRQPKMPG